MEDNEERVNPNVLMATLLDDANSHLSEISKTLLKLSSIGDVGAGERKNEIENLARVAQVLYPKKSIPYSSEITIQNSTTAPINENDITGYTLENVYNNNNNKIIERMTLICDGPGKIFYRVVDGKLKVNVSEETLNVGDQRTLFNVYEVRLRTDIPLTKYRLYEGEFRAGSFARAYKANTEIRPTLQANEKLKIFGLTFDDNINPIPITVPAVNPLLTNNAATVTFFSPLAPSATAAMVDTETGLATPYLVPTGYILETFALIGVANTDFTARVWFQIIPGVEVYTISDTVPLSLRGNINSIVAFNLNFISTELLDPSGAVSPGRKIVLTVTNDDNVNYMIGSLGIIAILRRLS